MVIYRKIMLLPGLMFEAATLLFGWMLVRDFANRRLRRYES